MKILAMLAIGGSLYTCQNPSNHNTQQQQPPDTKNSIVHSVPDAGSTLGLLTLGLAAIAYRRARLKS